MVSTCFLFSMKGKTMKIQISSEDFYIQLMNLEENKETLKKAIWKPFLNLAAVICVRQRSCYFLLPKYALESLKKTEEELFKMAEKNVFDSTDTVFDTLGHMLYGFSGPYDIMYVLTNTDSTLGASKIMDSNQLNRIADIFEDDLLILPSSIHECMIVPAGSEDGDVEWLRKTLEDVNKKVVKPKDYLADTVYYYNRHTKKITVKENE